MYRYVYESISSDLENVSFFETTATDYNTKNTIDSKIKKKKKKNTNLQDREDMLQQTQPLQRFLLPASFYTKEDLIQPDNLFEISPVPSLRKSKKKKKTQQGII